MKHLARSTLLGAMICSTGIAANAADFSVEVVNLTSGSYFTPLLVAAHPSSASLFTSGQAASDNLATMAEGGNITPLVGDLEGLGATIVSNPASGLLSMGASTVAQLNTDSSTTNTHLSIVAMILPSNDGFVGLNALEIPTAPGTYTYNVNAYDAGSEANDEIRGSGALGEAGFPVPTPIDAVAGTNGTGVMTDAEGFVHIHRNVLGDTNATGGSSDIDSTVHRWLNPVARVIITVNP